MWSRALTVTRPKEGDHIRNIEYSKAGSSFPDYEDCIVGFTEDLPLVRCGHDKTCTGCKVTLAHLTLRGVLRGSVGVIGESRLAMTEKVVLLGGRICAVKRFRQVKCKRKEFGKRIERLAEVSRTCDFLVPVTAYLYAKRIKFVISDYRPMGSLADLLAGARDHGHTGLDWSQRLTIIVHIAKAISFIHGLYPDYQKKMAMNVHGSIKASNVLVNTDFSACLSDYGLSQLAYQVEIPETWKTMKSPHWLVEGTDYSDEVSQKADIYNFGVILIDILSGVKSLGMIKKRVKEGMSYERGLEFVEFSMKDEKERRQVSRIFHIALACADANPAARPSIEEISRQIWDM